MKHSELLARIGLLLLCVFIGMAFITTSNASVTELNANPQIVDSGEVISITGKASPNEEVWLSASFEHSLSVSDGKYSREFSGVHFPSGEKTFSVTVENVKNVRVSSYPILMQTVEYPLEGPENATNGIATLSVSFPVEIYGAEIDIIGKKNVKIYGDAADGATSVNLKVSASIKVNADSNGDFSLDINTEGVPEGEFLISAGGIEKTVYIGYIGCNAFNLPTLPTEFCGFVESNGKPAPVGTEIVAKINGEERGKILIKEEGKYGGSGKFDEKLAVQGDDEEIGDDITFWVNGLKAGQTSKYEPGAFNSLNLAAKAVEIFDTESPENPYPSISGTHNGTIMPYYNINVSKIYTYSCPGTGGHTEYIKIWNTSNWNVTATWNGYVGDWHNTSFNEFFTLQANEKYNYTIKTGSYPQIHHTPALPTANGWINSTEFTDANGKKYDNWIPAIRLE